MNRKESIIAAIISAILAINVVLQSFGASPLDEGTVTAAVTAIVTICIWAYDFWRNHNFTEAAMKGQEVTDAEKQKARMAKENTDESGDE